VPPRISTALPLRVHHDTGGRAVVVFVSVIVHVLATMTTPTNTPTSDTKITKSSATGTTPDRLAIGIRSDGQQAVRDAIAAVPARTWAPALTPAGEVRRGAHVAEITGLLTVADGWPEGMRLMARTEPLHPRHRKQASQVERQRQQRFQVVACDLPGYRYPKLDAFHRNHAVVESAIKDGKDLGLRRLPGYALAFNHAWCTAVAIACDLLAWLRLLALDHHQQLHRASPAILRRTLLNTPARLVRRARKRLIRLDDTHPHQADLILAWNKIHALATPP